MVASGFDEPFDLGDSLATGLTLLLGCDLATRKLQI
jgi:hypothetical protein